MTLTADYPVLTVSEFAAQFKISRSLFYTLLKQGKAPRIVKVGNRTLIPAEAAREWLEQLGERQ